MAQSEQLGNNELAKQEYQYGVYANLDVLGTELDLVNNPQYGIDLVQATPLDESYNKHEGISQELVGVLQLGKSELLAVVRATDLRTGVVNATLNKFASNSEGRGEVIAAIDPDSELTVGRTEEGLLEGSSNLVSRQHLKITSDKDGNIKFQDLNSTNGTNIITAHEGSRFRLKDNKSWSPKSSTIREMFDAVNHSEAGIIQPKDVPKVDANVKPEEVQRPEIHPVAERIAKDSDFVGQTMQTVIEEMRKRDGFELTNHEFDLMFASIDFTARSILAALDTYDLDSSILDEQVVDALKQAFDLPILQQNTDPSKLDWSKGYQVKEHATMLQGKLNAFNERARYKNDSSSFVQSTVPMTLSRLTTGLAALSAKIARSPRASKGYNWSYVEKNQHIPTILAHNLIEKMTTLAEARKA